LSCRRNTGKFRSDLIIRVLTGIQTDPPVELPPNIPVFDSAGR